MNPREIEVHIEELVLHGFDPRSRWHIADALENELQELLAAKGLPSVWHASREKVEGGRIVANGLTNPTVAGKQIAAAVHRGPQK